MLETFSHGRARGAAQYRLTREGPRWWEGELRLTEGGAFRQVAPLVARFLEGIRSGATPSTSFEDGARAQEVLDAAVESVSRRAWVDVR